MNYIDFSKITDDFYKFVRVNEQSDVNKLRLKDSRNCSFDVDFAITQIECRIKIKKKLPEIYALTDFLYPYVLSTEQCTCELIAKLHANIIGKISSMLDMTGGLCIDDYYIAQNVEKIISIEKNDFTASVSRYNMQKYRPNIDVIACDSVEFIDKCGSYDAIFIDPSRRGDNNSRLYGIADCEPNVIALLPKIKKCTNLLYIKASPMIDITQLLRELPCVTDAWVVSLRNECKELFFKVDFQSSNTETIIHCLNIVSEDKIQEISYKFNDRGNLSTFAPTIQSYIYEPNASIMKANAFDVIIEKYNIEKMAKSSHLFTSNKYIDDFPGRVFRVIDIYPFKDKIVKQALKGYDKINVSVRNFKLTAEQLKQRFKIKDGGDKYLFATTLYNDNMVIILCEKA